ncbi:26s proteasome non-atpase regulatory subunit 5-related [Anaeramoeba flamelloides]|uniref:26s proteasome non-atpase regulatory subunit 5-related n=1 Tax=Anaeramoeba flamelloides TaxID=1746091 RepID=A0AAV7ZR84_9EUKA|nr:26s proteasome non-atpase regulatory subunit 5-related [Anaeramoeba flamelloides]
MEKEFNQTIKTLKESKDETKIEKALSLLQTRLKSGKIKFIDLIKKITIPELLLCSLNFSKQEPLANGILFVEFLFSRLNDSSKILLSKPLREFVINGLSNRVEMVQKLTLNLLRSYCVRDHLIKEMSEDDKLSELIFQPLIKGSSSLSQASFQLLVKLITTNLKGLLLVYGKGTRLRELYTKGLQTEDKVILLRLVELSLRALFDPRDTFSFSRLKNQKKQMNIEKKSKEKEKEKENEKENENEKEKEKEKEIEKEEEKKIEIEKEEEKEKEKEIENYQSERIIKLILSTGISDIVVYEMKGESGDILSQMSILETLTNFSKDMSKSKAEFVKTIVSIASNLLSSEETFPMLLGYLMRFFSEFLRYDGPNREMVDFNKLLPRIETLLIEESSEDLELLQAIIILVTGIASTHEGLELLCKTKKSILIFIRNLFASTENPIKLCSIHNISYIIENIDTENPGDFNMLYKVLMLKSSKIEDSDPLGIITINLKSPFLDIRLASYHFIRALCNHNKGLSHLINFPEVFDIILDKATDSDKAGLECKYEILQIFSRSKIVKKFVSQEDWKQLVLEIKAGPFGSSFTHSKVIVSEKF